MGHVKMEVEAYIDMSDFDDNELIDELRERGFYVDSASDHDEDTSDLMRLLELFKIGAPDAIEQTKIYLQDKTGKIL